MVKEDTVCRRRYYMLLYNLHISSRHTALHRRKATWDKKELFLSVESPEPCHTAQKWMPGKTWSFFQDQEGEYPQKPDRRVPQCIPHSAVYSGVSKGYLYMTLGRKIINLVRLNYLKYPDQIGGIC